MRKTLRRAGRETFRGITFAIVAAGSLWTQTTIPPVVSADAASLARGQRSLQRVRQAIGGTDRLIAIRDWMETLEIALEQAADTSVVRVVNRSVLPNHLRQERVVPSGNLTTYTDGKSGWQVTPQGVQGLSGSMLRQAQAELFRQPVTLMLSDLDASRTVNAIGETSIEITNLNGESVRIAFKRETGLPARLLYRVASPNGAAVEAEEIFSDWRDVGGIKMPYKWIIQENGAKTAEVTVSEYRFNTGITAEELSRKP